MTSVQRVLLASVAAVALGAAGTAVAMPPACSPPGSRVVDGSVVRWHRVTWFCATHPRRLVALPVPQRSLYVRHVVARGRFLAFS